MDNAYLYICHADVKTTEFDSNLRNQDWEINNKIIWVKDIPVYMPTKYRWQYEPIWFLIKGKPKWYGNNEVNVWEIRAIQSAASKDDSGKKWFEGGSKNLTLHPTQKPVELSKKAIVNSTKNDELIMDLFLGSGSTLIACEQTNRICYGMEIEPLYTDVTIRRWQQYTNQEAIREDGIKFNDLIDK